MVTRKFIVAAMLLIGSSAFAQIEPVINEEWIPESRMEQHEQFTAGDYAFPAKPRNQWHIGLNLGVPQLHGDVRSDAFGGSHSPAWGAGLNIRKGLGYVTSLRLHGSYNTAYGMDYEESSSSNNKTLNGSFANSTNPDKYSEGADYQALPWVSNYKSTIIHGSLDFIVNLNNINFHNATPKFLVYGFGGIGLFLYETKMDALDADGNEYLFNSIVDANGDGIIDDGFALSDDDGRRNRIDALHELLDGDYETQAEVANPTKWGDGTQVVNPSLSVGAGMSWKLGRSVELGIEHRMSYFFDDLADGQRWAGDSYTSHNDIYHYTNLTLGFNLGSKSAQPMWEVNPLNFVYNKLNEIDPANLLADSDDDGVIDYLDREPNTPAGTPVDTHGVSLDSDKDGCIDSEDPEPFSTPNLPIENCQNIHMTDERVNELIDARFAKQPAAATNWYLPMIFFDLDKSNIRPDAVPQLAYVADIMTQYPKMKVELVGHTDTRGSESYNLKLSENRAKAALDYLSNVKKIDQSRFIMKYEGEGNNLIPNARQEAEHQTNRRVEFHIAK